MMTYTTYSNTYTGIISYYGTTYTGYVPYITAHYVTEPARSVAVLPKSWRWFDRFRVWAAPRLLRLLPGFLVEIVRKQERYPVTQRVRHKRKRYIQKLYSQ